jgi:hypothetical protein
MASATRKLNGGGDRHVALSFFPAGDEPPREFRIFAAGLNTTTKGNFLFDEQAARAVMSAFEKHGADMMIDLEHLSINDDSLNFDPDARGWCRLEVRNGELWAVNVSWTTDGDARLREKRQRYVSPVFGFQGDARRITEILNIAITALPATDKPEALVAASARLTQIEGDSPMTPEQFAAIAEALGLGADANVEDVIATIAAMVSKVQNAANGDGDPEDAAEAPEGTPAAAAAAAPPVMAAARIKVATAVLARLSGKKEIGEVVADVEAWRASHIELEKSRTKLAQDRTTLESSERRRLTGELVKLGAETPATAWSDDDGKVPVERIAKEPIEELRARVAKLTAAKGKKKDDPTPPPSGGGDANGLTPEQLKICADTGCKPEVFAQLRKSNPPLTVRS